MGKRIAAWIILICLGLTSTALALTADDYVIAGRRCLFERTVSGLAQAKDILEAGISDTACSSCSGDRELMFLSAVAKATLLLIEHSETLGVDGFLSLAEQFGIPLAAIAFYEAPTGRVCESQSNSLWLPGTDAQTIRQTLCDHVLDELGEAVARLDAIADSPDPFIVYLAPNETGLAGDLEIDYGDVLALKGLLLAYRALLAGQLVGELEAEVNELVVDCNAAALLLGVDAPALAVPLQGPSEGVPLPMEGPLSGTLNDGTAILNRAREDACQAVDCYLEAVDYIAGEDSPPGTDPQEDEFVYIDPDADSRLDAFRQTLMTLGPASFEHGLVRETTETYEVYDTEATRLGRLTLVLSYPHLEGRTGRMILMDGSVLEVDWFGTLEEGQVAVSLLTTDGALEGWLEGTVESDRNVICGGVLDLWPMIDPGTGAQGRPGPSNALVPLEDLGQAGVWTEPASLGLIQDWSKMAWAQLHEILAPLSNEPFALPPTAQSAAP